MFKNNKSVFIRKQFFALAVIVGLVSGLFAPGFFVLAQSSTETSNTPTTPRVLGDEFQKDTALSVQEQLDAVREHLKANNIPQNIIERIDAYEAKLAEGPKKKGLLEQALDFVTGNSESQKAKENIEKIANKQPFKVRGAEKPVIKRNIDDFERLFGNQKESSNLKDKIKNFINTGTLNGNPINQDQNPSLSWVLGKTASAQASEDPNDYLAAGNEITFSQAVIDKANELGGDPLTMLNFVRNHIEYVPYYGSKKGSDGALVERAGNDMDQAALLIAMLRYSGVPARYQHVDAQLDVNTVTDLLGVSTANAAAQVLGLHDIPYILFVDGTGNPLFFVVEHTYAEAYIPYGYSRGADLQDGGDSQWVPMDPSINAYYYEQLVDVVEEMKLSGFDVEQFFSEYLTGAYGALEPQEAFKQAVETHLLTNPPQYYPNLTYDEALTRQYAKNQNLDFIPASLSYHNAAELGTYDYVPNTLRHTITFTVLNEDQTTALTHTAYVSELANAELLLTYDAATQADQDTLDTFDTIYDVVPLSLVNVKPKIKVNGVEIAAGSQGIGLGESQSYVMDFIVPERTIGSSVTTYTIDTVEKDILTGNTDAIALDTDRVIPDELRPNQDTSSSSFAANQVLYTAAQNYLDRLEDTQGELAKVIGGEFTDAASRATVFNGIEVTYDAQNDPYSFEWKGLRIDASITVRYFNHFSNDVNKHRKEYAAVSGLQASQDESDIFEDNFTTESVATVKGLRLVADGQIPGVTLRKITSANESDIDTLSVSQTVKDIYHAAVQAGNTIYTPSAPITYQNWQGLTYVNINFNSGDAAYTIGEGLNGGYTVEEFSSGWQGILLDVTGAFDLLEATIVQPVQGQIVNYGDTFTWDARYTASLGGITINEWTEAGPIDSSQFEPGVVTLLSGYNTDSSVSITIQRTTLGGTNSTLGSTYPGFDDLFFKYGERYSIPPDLLKSMAFQESCCAYDDTLKASTFDPNAYRYEAHKDYDWYSGPSQAAKDRIEQHPEWHFAIGGSAIHGSVEHGNQVPPVSEYQEWGYHMGGHSEIGLFIESVNKPTAQQLLDKYQDKHWIKYKGPGENWNFTAQVLLASSYGLLQALYETAKNRMIALGLETQVAAPEGRSVPKAVPVENLFSPDFSVKVGGGYLEIQYGTFGNWEQALTAYNGDPDYAVAVLNRWNNGNGMFKETTE